MPYCDPCARHWTPTSMRPDGSCPTCGQVLELRTRRASPATTPATSPAAAPVDAPVDAPVEDQDDEAAPSAPWHFKVLLVGLAIYLAWRGIQGVGWIATHL